VDTKNALTLREASYPAVFCLPRADVDMASLGRTGHSTYCPYMGDIPLGRERMANAVWTREELFEPVASIEDHLAFYTDRADSIVQHAAVQVVGLPGSHRLRSEPGMQIACADTPSS
jgi:uncharacterized protein (DUF427 family)